MDLDLIVLGTAGAVPTPERALTATLIRRGSERILIDCGEGTQRQLMRAGAGLQQVDLVLLTHFHADHYLGLPGMLKTWDLWGRTEPIHIYGPKGMGAMVPMFKRIIGATGFEIAYHEVAPGFSLERQGYRLDALATEHRIASVGWALVEPDRPGRFDLEAATVLGVKPGPDFGRLQRGESVPSSLGGEVRPEQVMGPHRAGRTVVVTGDTRPCPAVRAAARGAEVLVHDCTFMEEAADRARDTYHSTAKEAACLGREAEVGLLVLTHLSFRHHPKAILAEALEHFPRSVLPHDLDTIEVPLPEKGPPRWVPRPRHAKART